MARAGTSTHYRTSYSAERTSFFPAVRPNRETIRGDERPRLAPTLVQTLPVGACYLVPSGAYQLVAVAPLRVSQRRVDAFRTWMRGEADDPIAFGPSPNALEAATISVIVEHDRTPGAVKGSAVEAEIASPVEEGGFSSE